jgi:glycosyltransferase involved in cell wall biosynthesis
MPPRLGLGITTYNRASRLAETLDAVARFTAAPHELMVADDGSTDGTPELLRRRRVPHLRGPNRGVAWNKNRLLYLLHAVRGCDVVILLEDDTQPTALGWERAWIEAAERWGHANLAGDWFADRTVGGSGTPADPFRSPIVSGQCASFSRLALEAAGYMDTRFGRYGYEHCDHSQRLLRSGYGGLGGETELFYLIGSDLRVTDHERGAHGEALAEGHAIYAELRGDPSLYRRPYRTIREMRTLLSEVRAAKRYNLGRTVRDVARLEAIRARFLLSRLARRLKR